MFKATSSVVLGLAMTSTALGGVFYCCYNKYTWSNGGNCSGPSLSICDNTIGTSSCPPPKNKFPGTYTAKGCTKYTGSFATGVCGTPPGHGWIQLPGYTPSPDPYADICCYFNGTSEFTQSGTDLIQRCTDPCSCE